MATIAREVSTMAEIPPPKLIEEGPQPLPRPPHEHNQEEPWPWPRPPKHPGQGWTLAIAETNPKALSTVEKKQKRAPPSSWVPLLFWALAQAHWSSSKQIITTSKYLKSLKLKEGGELTSWLVIVCDGETWTWKWTRITSYTLWNPKKYFLQEMKSK